MTQEDITNVEIKLIDFIVRANVPRYEVPVAVSMVRVALNNVRRLYGLRQLPVRGAPS